MANGAKVTIDREACTSCGLCWSECPDFFEENANDTKSQVVEAYRISGEPAMGLAPPTLLSAVQEAADGCPVSAITVEESQ
jgi:ferredoxin